MPDLASVLEQACVPEHSAPFMQAMSQGTAFLEGEYLFLTADDWLMAIGYPLSGEYAHETFERALAAALRRVPKRLEGVDCWAIGPDLPVRLAGHVTDRDTFYILPCDAPVPARLRRPVETAAEKLTVREGRDFTPAHRRLWAEFMNRAVLPPNVRGCSPAPGPCWIRRGCACSTPWTPRATSRRASSSTTRPAAFAATSSARTPARTTRPTRRTCFSRTCSAPLRKRARNTSTSASA